MAKDLRWVKVDPLAQLPGMVAGVEIEGKRIALANTGTQTFAFSDHCPHAGARFSSGGWCENGKLVCPFHRHAFDLQSGRGVMGDYVQTYPVEMREDGMYIGLPEKRRFFILC